MISPKKYREMYDAIDELDAEQLTLLMNRVSSTKIAKENRFKHLCKNFYDYFETLRYEFPNSHVYLTNDSGEKIDLMKYHFNFNESFEIGG